MNRLYFIKDGKHCLLNGGRVDELPDGILDGYVRRAAESARRNEWKTSGEGAKFTGTYVAGADPQSRIQSIRASVNGLGEYGGALYFSERIDGVSGIYKKISSTDTSEAIAISSNDRAYLAFDMFDGRLAVSVMSAGEAHIGISSLPSFDIRTVTEGSSVELDPVWSRTERDMIYFSSAGLPQFDSSDMEEAPPMTPAAIMNAMNSSAAPVRRGPSSICRLKLSDGELETLLEDERFDFVKPFSAPDGSLYCVKKPYSAQSEGNNSLGCAADILLLPVRLIKALFGFLSFFSIKYSGTPLSGGGIRAKNKDAGQIRIDGNLINAEKELKANAKDENPGIIPKSFELLRIAPDGTQTTLRRGVLCYTLDDAGNVVYSNGKYIIRLNADGSETRLAAADGVTLLKYLPVG